MRTPLLLSCAAVVLCACDDTVYTEPSYVPPVTDSGTGCADTYDETWDGVVEMFDDHCGFCHIGGAAGPEIDTDILHADVSDGTGTYIVAGDAAGSLLWQRMGEVDGASPMPPGNALDDCERAHVEAWITAGALLD